jgi:hypothetical protein
VTLERAEVPELDLLDKDLLEVDDLLTHRLPLAAVTEAISRVRGRRVPNVDGSCPPVTGSP